MTAFPTKGQKPWGDVLKAYIDAFAGTAVQKTANLSDLVSAAAARANLGLGSAATKSVADIAADSLLTNAFATKDSAPVSFAKFNVLPSNTAAANRTGFANAAASGLTNFFLPSGTYDVAWGQNTPLMSFTGLKNITIRGDNALLHDTTAHTAQAGFTTCFHFDNCRNVDVSGIDYLGGILATPLDLTNGLGYTGATYLRAINGCKRVKTDFYAENLRYGVQTGDYADYTKGSCSGFDVKVRGKMIGYPLAAYFADTIRHDIDVDGVHRVVYIGGCDDVRGVAKFKDEHIASNPYLITDCITSGTDTAAQADPSGHPTTSRGCSKVDSIVIDKGSAIGGGGVLVGINLSRVDPCQFRDIKMRAYSKTPAGSGVNQGGFTMVSGAKAVQSRYPYNFEPTIVFDNIDLGGLVDHSNSTVADAATDVFYAVLYDYISDATAAHAATVRNFKVDGFTYIPSAVGATLRESYFWAPGLATPAHFDDLNTPGANFRCNTNVEVQTRFERCTLAQLTPGTPNFTAGGAAVVIGEGTTATKVAPNVAPYSNLIMRGGAIGGAGVSIRQREVTVALSGASSTYFSAIGAGEMLLGVQSYITTAITGATGFQLGISGAPTRFADKSVTAVGLASTPADVLATEAFGRIYPSLTNLVVTAKGSNFTGGNLRVIVTFMKFTPPTA